MKISIWTLDLCVPLSSASSLLAYNTVELINRVSSLEPAPAPLCSLSFPAKSSR